MQVMVAKRLQAITTMVISKTDNATQKLRTRTMILWTNARMPITLETITAILDLTAAMVLVTVEEVTNIARRCW